MQAWREGANSTLEKSRPVPGVGLQPPPSGISLLPPLAFAPQMCGYSANGTLLSVHLRSAIKLPPNFCLASSLNCFSDVDEHL